MADAARMLEKYLRRTAAAGGDYVTGMQNPRRDPVAAALRAVGKWENNLQVAIREKRYEAGVRGQDRAAAIEAATSDGGAAYVAGIQKRQGKVQAAFSALVPHLNQLSTQIQQMPQSTPEQREARAIAAIRGMRQIGARVRGGGGAGSPNF